VDDHNDRNSMTRLRTSGHRLQIENGIYTIPKHLYMTDFVRIVLIIWLKMGYIYFWAVLNLMTLGEILWQVVSTRISIELMIFHLNLSGYSEMMDVEK